jgi:hypothetical protein
MLGGNAVLDLLESGRLSFTDEGKRINPEVIETNPVWRSKLKEALEITKKAQVGRKQDIRRFVEAMSTSDFPILFGDIVSKSILANYGELPQTWQAVAARGTAPDFRKKKARAYDGAETPLDIVAELGEYTERTVRESEFEWRLHKYGNRVAFSWESAINDDIDLFRSFPQRFARAARRTEEVFVTKLYAGAAGPHGNLYTVGNGNILTGNPALSVEALRAAEGFLAGFKDADGNPIGIEQLTLVTGPALAGVAASIIDAKEVRIKNTGGTSNQEITLTGNGLAGNYTRVMNPYISTPIVTSNAATSWWLFANPSGAVRPALELDFLAGFEAPMVFLKAPNAMMIGGGMADPFLGDFDADAIEYKVRHVLGGSPIEAKATIASNGTGS